MADEGVSREQIIDEAVAALGFPDKSASRLRSHFRAGLSDESLSELAEDAGLLSSARGMILRQRLVDAVIYELASRGSVDPVFRELAGFGQPLPPDPDYADFVLAVTNKEELFDAVRRRLQEILAALRKAADEQVACERIGGRYYLLHEEDDAQR